MIDINNPDINNTNINNTNIINPDIINYIFIDISQECYICCESCDEISPCECIGLYIHGECLAQAITKLNNINCTICKSQYKNAIITTNYTYKISNFGCAIVLNIFISSCFNLIGLIEFYVYKNNDDNFNNNDSNDTPLNITLSFPFFSIGITSLLFVLIYWFYMYIKYNLQICKQYKKTHVKFVFD